MEDDWGSTGMLGFASKPRAAREAARADAASMMLADGVEGGEPALVLRLSPNASGEEVKEVGAEMYRAVRTGP